MKSDNGILIEQYLNGELSPEDILRVENLIKTDVKFSHELYLRKSVNFVLRDKKVLKVYIDLQQIMLSMKRRKLSNL